ncbi:Innexin-3 [Toxocara canis]|uniref:Innexin n=1 Tax=Toxocara canis TaxID=6265 RepID=A0A0B2UZ95_TOXCA|nr:Innexin-3 [Toxocara canis]
MLGIPFLDSAFLRLFSPTTYDDRIDRLNYFVTSSMLTFFAILVSAKQYVGSPIQCWMPMEFKGGWEQYAEDYCFIQNTYWVHFDEPVPDDVGDRRSAEIGYYQWVPIVLALQALMFFIPSWIWKTLHKQSGIDLDTIVKEAKSMRAARSEERKEEVTKLAAFVEESLEMGDRRAQYHLLCLNFGRSLGSYVSVLYIFVKLLYVLNIFTQFVILNNFLGTDYNLWGFQTLRDLWEGREWLDSGVFPRVTMCDFKVRRLANIHRYSVQCVLMINMFNEKIYLFIWFWFLFVAISTLLNFLYCFATMLISSYRERTAAVLLSTYKLDEESRMDTSIVRRFVHNALKPDGILLLRFVDMHAGGMAARDLCAQLFHDFYVSLESHYPRTGDGQTTKSTSPGIDEGFTEAPYNSDKVSFFCIISMEYHFPFLLLRLQ